MSGLSAAAGIPNRPRMSASGTTLPRTFTIRSTCARAPATRVAGIGSMISRTIPASSAKLSVPIRNITTCRPPR